jgi:hypothetical protein
MTTLLKGTFQITGWDETPYCENDDGSKQTHAKITQRYTGDIDGLSELQYLMNYTCDGNAVFVGLERLSCTINNKAGSVILKHNGKFEAGVASSHFDIVAGSGTQALAEISGSGTFTSADNGQAHYTLELTN